MISSVVRTAGGFAFSAAFLDKPWSQESPLLSPPVDACLHFYRACDSAVQLPVDVRRISVNSLSPAFSDFCRSATCICLCMRMIRSCPVTKSQLSVDSSFKAQLVLVHAHRHWPLLIGGCYTWLSHGCLYRTIITPETTHPIGRNFQVGVLVDNGERANADACHLWRDLGEVLFPKLPFSLCAPPLLGSDNTGSGFRPRRCVILYYHTWCKV